jgi:hypothetical protein
MQLRHFFVSSSLQLPKYMWVDNSRTSANQLYDALPSLMKILEDATHVMRRVFDVILDGHSLKGENASVVELFWCEHCKSDFKLRMQLSFLSI